MSELIAFVFRDQYRAPEVLNELRRRDWPWVRDLDDSIVITIDDHGRPRAQLNVDLSTSEAARWPRLWAALLNTTLFLPLTGVMVEAACGVASKNAKLVSNGPRGDSSEERWWQESLGQAVNFKRDVAASLAANGSALFLLLRQSDPAPVLKQLQNYGDTIVHTTLSDLQDTKMQSILGATAN